MTDTTKKILEWLDKNAKYHYYTDSKAEKTKKSLDHNVFNCSDRVDLND